MMVRFGAGPVGGPGQDAPVAIRSFSVGPLRGLQRAEAQGLGNLVVLAGPNGSGKSSLAGARDRALLLIGFVGALRRSELAALAVDDIAEHANGLVLTLSRSKTNQTGEEAELVVLPRAGNPDRCPVTALQTWLTDAEITAGPMFRGVTKSNRPSPRGLHPESVNDLIRTAAARAGQG